MKAKNFVSQTPIINGCKITPTANTVDVFTDLKNRRQELEAVIDVMNQYVERTEILEGTLVLKNIDLEDIETKISLAYEQLENINLIIKQDQNYLGEVLSSTEQQEIELTKLCQIIKERAIDADELQQILTSFKNKKTEFDVLQDGIISRKELLAELDAEILNKESLIDACERNYAKKLHREVKITEPTKFNQMGQI